MDLVIYGAQGIALGVHKAIKEIFPNRSIKCFIVTSIGNNAHTLDGLPVIELSEFVYGMSQLDKENVEVLIGTTEDVMLEIEKSLDDAGLHSYVRVDSIRWSKMQEIFFSKTGVYMPLTAYPVGFHKSDLALYKMIHFMDKELKSQFIQPVYMHTLQVGAETTDLRIADIQDNDGDNISLKNGNYSELTGMYWIWKNRVTTDIDNHNKYYGLAHYRRILDLSEDDHFRLVDNNIDVILPYPMPYEPNIEVHHERYLSCLEWKSVLQALEELQPVYALAFSNILKQEYLYNYNILIAKANIFNDYCSWLFPLLFRIEEIINSDGNKEPNRFIGYIGETLETLYFMYNKEKFIISHAGYRFLV